MILDESEKNLWQERRSGPEVVRPQADFRSPYTRDRARVIHSAAFRRLQAKTQVLGIGEGDFHRTRLTHSMEVAQIARGIVRALHANLSEGQPWKTWLPDQNLIETIALSHDLGHPPFGHGGEIALNYAMRNSGGFEGNGQTLRLLALLEAHTDDFGLDLTRRCLLGVLKYPVVYETVVRTEVPALPQNIRLLNRDEWKPPKCYMSSECEVVQWVLTPFREPDRKRFLTLKSHPDKTKHGKSLYHAFDTGIMELADDISYGVHDFEDAIALGMVGQKDWARLVEDIDMKWAESVGLLPVTSYGEQLFSNSSGARKRAIGGLVNAFIVSVNVDCIDEFRHPLLKYQAFMCKPAAAFLDRLKSLVVEKVIKTPQVQTLEYRGQQLVISLFEAFASDPERLLKENFRITHGGMVSQAEKHRVICDYIAGMTDEYATRMYERLFMPRHGQFSDRL